MSLTRFALALSIFALLAGSAVPSQALNRIALLIANQAYVPSVGPLENPRSDVALLGAALSRVGFRVMNPIKDASRADILVAVHDFADELKRAGPDAVGFFYYSGHGVAISGENYVVPVDVTTVSRRQIAVSGVRLGEISKILQDTAPLAAHYLVFDACRNNLGGGKGAKGFLPVGQQSGLLIAFATSPGQVASDLGKGGGPYARALASEIVKPGVPDLLMFHKVRVAVKQITSGEQIPWTMDGIQREQRVFFGGDAGSTSAQKSSVTGRSAGDQVATAWAAISHSNDPGDFELFIQEYGSSNQFYRSLAANRLAALRRPRASLEEMRAPVDRLFEAWNALNLEQYITQWAPDGVKYDLRRGTRKSLSTLRSERRRLFSRLSRARARYQAKLREDGENYAIFDVSYKLSITFRNGRSVNEKACEDYRVERRDGRWLIAVNRDYATCR